MYPVYYPISGDTLPVLFPTFGSSNESITMSGFAVGDIKIYKDGSVTQRSSTSGFTLLDTDGIDFDSITGIHGFSIDLSDDTDSGFYSVGPWYHVVISTITVDSQTVSFVACAFRIVSATRGLAGTALPAAAADAAGGLPISDAGGLDLDTQLGHLDADITSRLAPTTASRTLDVTATGAAGVDWGNVENKTTTNDLTGTKVAGIDGTKNTLDDLNDVDVTAAQTESYATDGSTASIVQMLYMIWSLLAEANASGTTVTCKKLDGSTTSMTFTIDDASTPSTITRAT